MTPPVGGLASVGIGRSPCVFWNPRRLGSDRISAYTIHAFILVTVERYQHTGCFHRESAGTVAR
jgi:hypothetical protein